jgi:hypothetical protein
MDGTPGEVEPLWRSRLRWRLKGAMLWPAFAVLTVVDAILLGQLPIAGDGGTAFVPALLLAGFFNLLAVGVVGPLLAYWLRRRRRLRAPRVIAEDLTGTVLLGVVTLGFLAGGIVHHGDLQEARHDLAVQQATARSFISERAPAPYDRGAEATTTLKLQDDLFRTCAPGDDPDEWFCVYVNTAVSPPGITVDRSREANDALKTPGGFR